MPGTPPYHLKGNLQRDGTLYRFTAITGVLGTSDLNGDLAVDASGDIPSVPLNQVLLRNRSVIGIDWGIWAMTHGAEQRALLGDLLAMVAAGTLDPVRPTEYPLDNVAGALEDLLGRRAVGKIALVP